MNNTNYYKDHNYNMLEMAVCLEVTDDGKGKFYIPALTPFLDNSEPYDKTDPPVSTSNIISGTKGLDIEQCITSNYISMSIPSHINNISVRDKFVISFIGGDINKPYIIGRYDQ